MTRGAKRHTIAITSRLCFTDVALKIILGSRCVDYNQRCYLWAGRGECSKNPNYMLQMCAKSCGQCVSGKNNEMF